MEANTYLFTEEQLRKYAENWFLLALDDVGTFDELWAMHERQNNT
jgi:hypothetical protein